MKIIALTDIHGDISKLSKLRKEIEAADAIILTGDITHFGREKEAQAIIDRITSYNNTIFAVSGNCDYPQVEKYLNNKGYNINKYIQSFNGYELVGLSGSLPCPGKTPNEYSDSDYSTFLTDIGSKLDVEKNFILVSHQPPFNTKNDEVEANSHVGSTSVRKFIEKYQPLLCLTGHIHEGIGIDKIGQTQIINPGPFKDGYYTYARLINGQVMDLETKKV